jgi:hypothetical protein
MEPKNNLIFLDTVRRRRRIQKLKCWFMKPTVVASLFMLVIYGVLISNYFIEKDRHPPHGLINSKVELENLPPFDLNK